MTNVAARHALRVARKGYRFCYWPGDRRIPVDWRTKQQNCLNALHLRALQRKEQPTARERLCDSRTCGHLPPWQLA